MEDRVLYQRRDLFLMANSLQLRIRHYARGYFQIAQEEPRAWLQNRLFFVLDNPDGDSNHVMADSAAVTFEAGTLYFIPAGYPVKMHLNGRMFFLSVQFNLEFFPGLDLFSGCTGIRIWKSPEMLPRLLEIFDSPMESSPLAAMELNRLVYDAALCLSARYPAEAFREVLRFQRYFPLIRHLEQHGNAATRVADLAALMSEGRENFTRRFHLETGYTPKEFLQRVLTDKAMNLLLTGIPVKEASVRLGFSDEFAFSRFFKRQMGISPSVWKNMNPLPRDSSPHSR